MLLADSVIIYNIIKIDTRSVYCLIVDEDTMVKSGSKGVLKLFGLRSHLFSPDKKGASVYVLVFGYKNTGYAFNHNVKSNHLQQISNTVCYWGCGVA